MKEWRLVWRLLAAAVLSAAASAENTCSGLHPALLGRIQKDVAWLDKVGGITDAMIRNISLVCDKGISHQCNVKVVRIMIRNGEVFLNSLHPNWRLGPPELVGFLLELYEASKLYRLPDVEFAFNGDDDAHATFNFKDGGLSTAFHGGPFPLLAWSKGGSSSAILVPYSGAFRCTADSFDSLLTHLDDIRRHTWDKKKEVAFGRWNMFCAPYYRFMTLPTGEPFPCPRQWLPVVSRNLMPRLDVAVLSQVQSDATRLGSVPISHQLEFKYLVSTDGWAISSKFDKYLLLGSLVIKAHSPRFGFYYDALAPDTHYLPCLNESMDDIIRRLRWARANDGEAARMAAAAQAFAVRHLHRGARLCYYRALLEELGKRMRYTPDCSQRKLCIPLARFLHVLASHERTAATCPYQELLVRYGSGEAPSDEQRAQLLAMLQQPDLWPRDTDIPPLDDDPYFEG